jgi:DNA-binding SARP family transcriptional activator
VGATPIPLRAKEAHVLLRLVVSGRPVQRDVLVDDVWSVDGPERQRRAALRSTIYRLRNKLGDARDCIVQSAATYALDVPEEALDANRFDRLMAVARSVPQDDASRRARAFEEALAVWRGPPCTGMEDLEFVAAFVSRYVNERVAASYERYRAELSAGRDADVVADLDALTREHPFHEGLWALYIAALYRTGRHADAVRAYGRVRESLLDELGLAPGPDLQRLERAMLRSEPDEADRPHGHGADGTATRAGPGSRSPCVAYLGARPETCLLEIHSVRRR